MADVFKTPAKPQSKRSSSSWNEVIIPKSPMLKLLGYGTGIKVSLLDRSTPRRVTTRSPWAVKRLSRHTHVQPAHAERLAREAEVLRHLQHPHVVGYRGVAPGPRDGTVSLLMEAATNSLFDLIEVLMEAPEPRQPFPLKHIAKVGEDVASALHYLHVERHLLHGDMKSGNVLIFGDFFTAKVCDFGVTLPLDDRLVVSAPGHYYVGTEPWSAPEAVHDQQITHKTDIYAYALTLWEMFAVEMPHALDLPDSDDSDCSDLDDSEAFSNSYYDSQMGIAPPVPQYGPAIMNRYRPFIEFYAVASAQDPDRRPSADQCRTFFHELNQKLLTSLPSEEPAEDADSSVFYSDSDQTETSYSGLTSDEDGDQSVVAEGQSGAGDDSVCIVNETALQKSQANVPDRADDKENQGVNQTTNKTETGTDEPKRSSLGNVQTNSMSHTADSAPTKPTATARKRALVTPQKGTAKRLNGV